MTPLKDPKYLEKARELFAKIELMHSDYLRERNVTEAIADALAVARQEGESRWISVEERLPEDEGKYLVANDDGNWPCSVLHWSVLMQKWCTGANNIITHWQPLPAPPLIGVGREGDSLDADGDVNGGGK